ncbi:MAG TPA: outer membrane protein transport protein [Polyangiaceae bacterium]|jgi:long-subunit fatty acid transport protein|nr:outer membrane protein transport protein [Polyangiaceae bacterium]
MVAVRASLALALLVVVSSAQATPASIFGLGPESQALAGTGTSHQGGFAASYTNPAGLSREPTKQLELGFGAAIFTLNTHNQSGVRDANLDDATRSLMFGLVAPLPLPSPLGDRLVLGLSVSSPGSDIARVQIANEARDQFPFLAPRADALNFNLGLGARLPWGLRVGVGSGVLASLRGTVALDSGASGTTASGATASENTASQSQTSDTAAARSVTDDELRLSFAPVVGLSYSPNAHLDFGAVYRGQLQSRFDLLVTVDNLGQLVVPPLHVTGLAGTDPAEQNLEASYHASVARAGEWRVVLGLTHRQWQSVRRLRDATIQCPDTEPGCGALPAHELDLDDTWVPRLAFAWKTMLTRGVSEELRAGYFFEPSPIASNSRKLHVYDNPRHALSVGYALQVKKSLALRTAFALQWHHLIGRANASTENGEQLSTGGDILSTIWSVGVDF